MKQLKRIREPEVKKILRSEFAQMKRRLNGKLNHIRFKSIKFFWWFKPERKHERVYGTCYKNGRQINISRRYYERNGNEDFINLLRHELLHLLEANHGPSFKALAKFVGTTRYASEMKSKQ